MDLEFPRARAVARVAPSDASFRPRARPFTPAASPPSLAPSDVVSPHLPLLRARARALTRNREDADDLLQDTCVRALADLRRRKTTPTNVAAWLQIILRNAWFNTLRARRAQAVASMALAEDHADLGLLHARASRAQLERIWARVPRAAQSLLVQCVVEAESREAISLRNGVTPGAIDASLYRTRRIFRAAGLER
jgi:RNA polymerase sigma-70 factor (ECF subfamily)